MPKHAEGLIGLYGPAYVAEANAIYRGYDLDPYACGLAVMSPSDIGKIVWLRVPEGEWFGPCLAVDISARKDFKANVVDQHKVVEADQRAADALGFKWGVWGESYVGLCPPFPTSQAREYEVWLEPDLIDPTGDKISYLDRYYPLRPQQMPIDDCAEYAWLGIQR